METTLSIIALAISVLTFLFAYSIRSEMKILDTDILDCSTRTRTNKLHLDTLTNKVNKPKRKPGRPKKNAPKPHKIVHQLNGE